MSSSSICEEPSPEQLRQLKKEKEQRNAFLGKRKTKTEQAQVGGRASQTDGARGVRYLLVPFVANWLDRHYEELEKRGRMGVAAKELCKLAAWIDTTTMAHIAVSVVLDSLGRGCQIKTKITAVKRRIGEQIEHQAQIAYMEDADPEYFKKLQKYYLNDPVRRYDKKVGAMRHAHNRHEEMDWQLLTDSQLIQVGSIVLQAIMSIQIDPDTREGFFQKVLPQWDDPNKPPKASKNHSDAYMLGFTQVGLKYRDKLQDASDKDAMLPLPMVCPPMDWSKEQRGGYLSHVSSQIEAMVHNNSGSEPSQIVYDALNRLQRVPFRINSYILDLQLDLLRKTWEIGSFRSYEKDSWTDAFFPIVDSQWLDTLSTESDEYKAEMLKLSIAYHDQKIDELKAESPRRVAHMAEQFRDEQFYFPWYLDSRGRLYPTVTGLSPQGADYAKALLKSATGAPLTEDTRRDMLISIATAGAFEGVDKKDFFERMTWAEKFVQTDGFLAMVNEPMDNRIWMDADEPFSFLALCEEYKAVFIDETRSRVYVFFGRDQTCSGVQILSAIIQDPKAAYFTNVLVTEEPKDLYGEVAREAQILMQDRTWLDKQMEAREAKRLSANAKRKPDRQIEPRWTFPVDPAVHDRKTNKTQAMTCGYGATIMTRYKAIKKALAKKEKAGSICPIHPGDLNIVCKAGIDGMEVAFPAYMELNKWFKKFATAVIKAGGEHIQWTTPSGMFVKQEYRVPEFKQINTYAAGGGHYSELHLAQGEQAAIDTGYGDPALSKSCSAIAANWTHSLDGSIMQLGLTDVDPSIDVLTVHDCVYCLSGYFGEVIPKFRKAMHNVVTSPVLENLLEENGVLETMSLPPIGELDVSQIKESPYLFC
ncbi:hypothetical protein OAE23_01500 [Synechococcus sp. AH-551-E11]|nr:DNA-directed RNA polymerase [Synechococcus sp. AH-551-E11]MDB4616758.1 hypothetical protein [Synechococcus sp. AH-551-E11]